MERAGTSQGSSRQNSVEKCGKQSSIDRCSRHNSTEQASRQNSGDSESSVGGVSGVRGKDLVHKCHSDPGGGRAGPVLPKVPPRPFRFRSSGGSTRRCVLTLDGYSYVIVASPPDRRATRDDAGVVPPPRGAPPAPPPTTQHPPTPPARNGQLAKQGSLTIVRRSSGKNHGSRSSPAQPPPGSPPPDHLLDQVDLATDNLPPVDTPDACDKAALRLRCVLRQLHRGEVSADVLQKNLNYAARVLEAVFIDETNSSDVSERIRPGDGAVSGAGLPGRTMSHDGGLHQQNQTQTAPRAATITVQKRRLRTPVWARPVVPRQQSAPTLVVRRLADEDDELSEVQPDAVPPEVREWLASTFTRQLATTRRKNDEKPKFRSVAHAIRAGIFVDRIYRRVSNSAMMQFPPEVVRVLKTLDDWSFDVFGLSEAANSQPVKYLGYDLLNRYGIIHKFKVPPITLELFLTRIEEGYCRYKNPYHNNLHAADVSQSVHYMLCQTGLMIPPAVLDAFLMRVEAGYCLHDNPYHNNLHSADVTQTVHCMLFQSGLANWLTDLEIFATLVAALIHDYEHTGTTNNFHVMSGSDIALMYNDKAVLENHHISAAFRVMKEEECNILQNLSRDEFREFRTLVIDMVLATDMSFHFQQIKNMRNLLTLAEPSVDKSKAVSLVLHCCDISHPAKRWDIHNRWTMLLLEEFFRQGDMEQEMGLPFSPLCDRNNTLVAESQIGFIEFIVEPSMAVCADMLEYILAPLHAGCKTGSPSQGSTETIQEDNMDSSNPKNGQTYKFKKPWAHYLGDNKKIWKDQAAKDAEARALAKKEEEGKIADED